MPDYLKWLMKHYHFEKSERINAGWSSDEKYCVVNKEQELLLLRLSESEDFEDKKREFERIKQFNQLPNKMSRAIDFGQVPGTSKIYMLLSYIEGADLQKILPFLDKKEQYKLGIESGEILNKFHQISIDVDESEVLRKLHAKKMYQMERFLISSYNNLPGIKVLETYVRKNSFRILNQPVVLQHGDFHPNNLIYTHDKQIGVIDFNRSDIGDPYEEFYKLQMFGKESSTLFIKGLIMGYFEGDIPNEFWIMQKLYVFHTSLFSIIWAEDYFKKDVEKMIGRLYQNLEDYEGGRLLVPKWWYR